MNDDKLKYRNNLKFLSKVDQRWIILTFKIKDLSRVAFYPNVQVILSCKTTHIKKYSASRFHFHTSQLIFMSKLLHGVVLKQRNKVTWS